MVRIRSTLADLALILVATSVTALAQADGRAFLRFSRDERLLHMVFVTTDKPGTHSHVRAITYVVKTGAKDHAVDLQPDTAVSSITSDGRTAVVMDQASTEHGRLSLLDTETGHLESIPAAWYDADQPIATISGNAHLIATYTETESDTPMTVNVYDRQTKTLVARRTSAYVSAGGLMDGGITEDGEVEFEGNRVGSTIVELKTGRVMARFGPSSVRSPDGKWVIQLPNLNWDETSSTDVLLKDGFDGKTIGKLSVRVSDEDQNLYGALDGAFCGTSGRFILATPKSVAAYALPSGNLLAVFPTETWKDANDKDTLSPSVACSATGTRAAILNGARLTFHDLK